MGIVVTIDLLLLLQNEFQNLGRAIMSDKQIWLGAVKSMGTEGSYPGNAVQVR